MKTEKVFKQILCPPVMCSNFILQNKVLKFPISLTYLFLVHCISWVHSLHDEWKISCDISPRNIFVWSNHIYRPYLSLLISKTFFSWPEEMVITYFYRWYAFKIERRELRACEELIMMKCDRNWSCTYS